MIRMARWLVLVPLTPSSSGAQDFPDVQRLSNKVLFAREDVARDQRAAEQRRIDELGRRAAAQDAALQTQAAAVDRLGGELRAITDERHVLDIADAFDGALVAGQFAVARQLLAAAVVVDLPSFANAGQTAIPADDFIARLPVLVTKGGVLPRANQRVRVEGDHATLTADGYAWRQPGRTQRASEEKIGRYEYVFDRLPSGWKIARLTFAG